MDISRFESLGDNCEFGFVQRHLGVDPGGLLRWATTGPHLLPGLIRSEFDGIYHFENLTPSSRDMVRDAGSGVFFHSRMTSTDGVFDHSEAERRAIHGEEIGKIRYLVAKLLAALREGRVFVLKHNRGLDVALVDSIAAAIAERGPGWLLNVTAQGELPVGEVAFVGRNVFTARVDRLAPYDKADDVSYEVWTGILARANRIIP